MNEFEHPCQSPSCIHQIKVINIAQSIKRKRSVKVQGIWSLDVPYVTEYCRVLNLNQHQMGHFTSYLVSSKL